MRERRDVLLVIAAGGASGSLARWAVTAAVPHADGGVPWATWWENVSGAFVLGALMVFILDVWPPSRHLRPFLGVGILGGLASAVANAGAPAWLLTLAGTGFCGALTTFSTFGFETVRLLEDGSWFEALTNMAASLTVGMAAVAAGWALVQAVT